MIVDETGSMHSNKAVTISAYNEFLDTQRESANEDEEKDEKVKFTLCKFNVNCRYVEAEDIKDAQALTNDNYKPSNCTALYDAIGDTLTQYEKETENVCVIITDGEENSSRKYNRDKVFKMIKEYEEKKEWMFHYLGANQDAFAVGASMNMASAQCFSADTKGFQSAYNDLEERVQNMRGYQGYKKAYKSKMSKGGFSFGAGASPPAMQSFDSYRAEKQAATRSKIEKSKASKSSN